MRNANLRKEQLQNEFNQQYEQIEKLVFNGSTEEDEKKKLQDKREELEKYIDGLEKSYSLEQLRNDLAKTERDTGRNIDDFDAEINAMELSEKISASEYETLKKKIDLKKKEIALDELRSNKTIRQLTKNADGIWNYEYSVDQDAVDQAQDEYTQAQIDFINYNEDLNLQSQEDELNDKSEYLSEIKKIQENALNGQYKTQEEFVNAMQNLNNKLGTDYKGIWTEIVSAQLNANGLLSGQLITMKSSYSTFVTDMTTLSTSLSNAITSSALAMQNAVTSMASAIQRYNDMLANQTTQQSTIPVTNIIGSLFNNEIIGYKETAVGQYVVTYKNGHEAAISKKAFDENFKKYADGGETQFTGMHWLDGKIGKPERVLTSEQTTSFNKLVDMLPSLGNISSMIPKLDVIKNWLPNIALPDFSSMFSGNRNENKTEQHFHINKLEFPNVTNSKDIENCILNLPGVALQFVK